LSKLSRRHGVLPLLPETINIDGRGLTIQDAIKEMWSRMQPLEARGFHPISEVEIVDASKKEIIQVFQLTDPEFQLHLKSDQQGQKADQRLKERPHAPERKEDYPYIARIRLEF
jgi:hypothetical protein